MLADSAHINQVISHYDTHATESAHRFLGHTITDSIGALLTDLPAAPADILDVGAGPGRDALWFMAQGYRVVAIEPAAGLRQVGIESSAGTGMIWLDDRLPTLPATRALERHFDFILLSAVWMFLPPAERLEALQSLTMLLKPAGKIGMTVQSAFVTRQELKFATSDDDFAELAHSCGLTLLYCRDTPDVNGRPGVSWQTVLLQKP